MTFRRFWRSASPLLRIIFQSALFRRFGLWPAIIFVMSAPISAAAPPSTHIRLTDVTESTGIGFTHTDGGTGERYIVESVVAGLALLDYNGDRWIDIYFLNGAVKDQAAENEGQTSVPCNRLYRNNGDWTFTDVTEEARVGDGGYGLGVTAADYDNDGDQDIYLNNFGPNVLYRNNGDGTFTDVTEAAGVRNGDQVGAGAAFLDIEADGDLDLFVSNYVDFDYDRHIVRMVGPYQFHPGPNDYPPTSDNLFRNNGDGTFTDITSRSGIADHLGTGMGVVCLDYDGDRDTDIFVCNDHMPNFLFQNDGRGHFEEVGLTAGIAYDRLGNKNGSMGADCGDYDNDGHLDLFMTDYSSEMPVLYHNVGGVMFEDATAMARISPRLFPHVTWGNGFVDFDNDGHRDLFVACGHFMDNIRHIDDRTSVRVRNCLMWNRGDGTFADITDQCGDGLLPVEASKGAAFDDLDNDGDVDAVILNQNARPTIIRNDSEMGNHWLQIELEGSKDNRDAVGARVFVETASGTQCAEIHSGRSYQSHYGRRLNFGFGKNERVEKIRVVWLRGESEEYTDLEALDRHVLIKQGEGISIPHRVPSPE